MMLMCLRRLLTVGVLLGLAVGAAEARETRGWLADLGIQPGAPLVGLPPAAGPVVGVIERSTSSRLTQIIGLRGDPGTVGQNAIRVTLSRGGGAFRVTQEEIVRELAAQLPGVGVSFANTMAGNAMGSFGYATGRAGGQACLYAWQLVPKAGPWIGGTDPGLFGDRYVLSIRVRLCRSGFSTPQLVALMQQLQAGGGGPFLSGPVPGGGDALSAATVGGDAVLQPYPLVQPYPAIGAPTPVRPRRIRREPAAPVASTPPAPPPVTRPLAGMPAVPMPR